MTWHLYWSHHISAFSAVNLPFTCFCYIACFLAFCEFWCHFLRTLCLNIYYEIFCFVLVWRGLKSIKLEKYFFLPTSNKFAIENNPLMQLLSIFHKKTKWKSENFSLSRLGSFSAIKKLWKEGEGKFILFVSLFLTIHINFQYKWKCHTSFFIVTFFYCFTNFFFSPAISLFFVSLIFDY